MLKTISTVCLSTLLSANAMGMGWTCQNTVGGSYRFTAGGNFSGSVSYNGPLAPFKSGPAMGGFTNLVPFQRFDFNAASYDGMFFSYSCFTADGGAGHVYNCVSTGPNMGVTLIGCEGQLF
jgi:hypothetical protein